MESATLANTVVDEDIELIKEIFKHCPEYAEYLLNSSEKTEGILDEIAENK